VHSFDPIPQPEPAPAPIEVTPLPVDDHTSTGIDLLDVLLLGFAILAAFLVIGGIAAAILAVAYRARGMSSRAMEDAFEHNAFLLVPMQFGIYLAIAGFMAFLVWVRHQTSLFRAIHWNVPGLRRALGAVMAGVVLAMISDIGEVALHPWIPKSLPITEYFRDRPSALLLGAFGILVAPLMEEIVFRGFIYPALARWTGVFASVLVTAFLFTMLHGSQLGYSWAPMLLIFIVGVTLTVTRAVTKSVATCVMVHMSYNFALLAQTYVLTDGFRHMQGV
jgi:hypothetical protein